MKKALVIIKYRRAATYFRNLLDQRSAATRMVRWYRLSRDRKRFVSMRKAEKVVKVWHKHNTGNLFITMLITFFCLFRSSGWVDEATSLHQDRTNHRYES